MLQSGLKDLLASERGTICVLLVLVSVLFVLLGKLDVTTWLAYTKWIATALVASKTVTGAIETVTGANAPAVAQPTP